MKLGRRTEIMTRPFGASYNTFYGKVIIHYIYNTFYGKVNKNRFDSIGSKRTSGEAKHSNRSCYANSRLPRTSKTIVNLHRMICCYA